GTGAVDGFTELRELDSNDDGVISAEDQAWSGLLIWQDLNGDGYSQEDELNTLEYYDIISIDLNATEVSQTNQGHNVSHVSTFTIDNGSGSETHAIHDIWFQYDDVNTQYIGEVILDVKALLLPIDLRGYGTLPDLHIALRSE